MRIEWDMVLNKYVNNIIAPDGRDTFESTPALVDIIMHEASVGNYDVVLDIGCGWGNVTRRCAVLTAQTVIGVEPNPNNINEAYMRSVDNNINYIHGSFEQLNIHNKADVAISSLAFHQVRYKYKARSLRNVKNALSKSGRFVLCDVLLMFDAIKDPAQFNNVYRYLLEKTTPKDIYYKYIEPHMNDCHVYTLADMRKYTPRDNWFYSLDDLTRWLEECDLKVTKELTLCPFLGIITIENK